jgi:hypothetical protein
MKSLSFEKSLLCLFVVACGGTTVDLGGPPDGGAGHAGSTGNPTTTTNGQGGGTNTTQTGAAGDRPGTTGTGGTPGAGGTGAGGSGGSIPCGGLTPNPRTCPAGMYCDYPADSMCGAADQPGICQPKPQVCTADCPGVCGCDGKFYCNACGAHSAGVDDSSDKSCLPKADAGQLCGTIAGLKCPDGTYCKYNKGEECGIASDGSGTCQPRPQGCTLIFSPVCACDGKIYPSECAAASNGQDVAGTPRLCPDAG